MQPVNGQCISADHWLHDLSAGLLLCNPGPSLGTDRNLICQIYGGCWQFLAEVSFDTTIFPFIPMVKLGEELSRASRN